MTTVLLQTRLKTYLHFLDFLLGKDGVIIIVWYAPTKFGMPTMF